MLEQLASAGVSAAGNLVGGLLSQAFAKKNAKIQFNNQSKLMDKQNAYTEWQQLNGQALDKQGLKNAGLSTATMQGPMNLAPSAGGTASMPTNPSFGNLGSDAVTAFQNAKIASAQARLADAQAEGLEIDNETKGEINKLNIDQLKKNLHLTDEQIVSFQQKNQYDAKMFKKQLKQADLTIDTLKENLKSVMLENGLKANELQFNIETYPYRIQQEFLRVEQLIANNQLTRAQTQVALRNVALISENITALQLSNDFDEATLKYRIDGEKAEQASRKAMQNTHTDKVIERIERSVGIIGTVVGTAVGAFTKVSSVRNLKGKTKKK